MVPYIQDEIVRLVPWEFPHTMASHTQSWGGLSKNIWRNEMKDNNYLVGKYNGQFAFIKTGENPKYPIRKDVIKNLIEENKKLGNTFTPLKVEICVSEIKGWAFWEKEITTQFQPLTQEDIDFLEL